MTNKIKICALFEILILVLYTFAIAFLLSRSFNNSEIIFEEKKIDFLKIYEKIIKIFIDDKNLVSAQSSNLNFLNDLGIDTSLLPNDGTIGRIMEGLQSFGINPQEFLDALSGEGVSICKETKSGSKCQFMRSEQCSQSCVSGGCVRVSNSPEENIRNIPRECKLGTCQDLEEGICMPNTPKSACDELGQEKAKWFDDPNGNVAECLRGCCIIGTEGQFTTELQCKRISESLGAEFGQRVKFDKEINTEAACLEFVRTQVKNRACTFETEDTLLSGKRGCKIVETEEECNTIGGTLEEEGKMCSHPSLKTSCEPMKVAKCVEGFEEVYWFDSCDNRENIVDLSKEDKGWNGGIFLKKSESCEIGNAENFLQNQATCGNCNSRFSSVCGEETDGQELNEQPDGNVVCRDLRCKDEEGKIRENGETWCAYQSNFGVFGLDLPFGSLMQYAPGGIDFLGGLMGGRSMGPPGSQFYRKSCVEGKIEIEACQDARRAICVETRDKIEGTEREISVASCRANRWQECLKYNPENRGDNLLGKIRVQIAMMKCDKDPDCFVRNFKVDKHFKFPMCLPKYPPGFELGENGGGGDVVCSYASQSCPVIFVKKARFGGFGGFYWDKEVNEKCVEGDSPESAKPSRAFIKEMSDFCTSLGDCGLKVNYLGAPGELGSFGLKKCVTEDIEGECRNRRPVIGSSLFLLAPSIYSAQIATDLKPIPADKYIDGKDAQKFFDSLGDSTTEMGGGLFGGDSGGGGNNNLPGISEQPGFGPTGGIATVAGASALGAFALGKTVFSTTTTSTQIFSSMEAAQAFQSDIIAKYGESAASVITQSSDGTVRVSTITAMDSPQLMAFGKALSIGAIAAAAAGILIAVSGIGRGLGTGWTYFYTGAAFTGGVAAGYGFFNQAIVGPTTASFLQVFSIITLTVTFTMLILNILFGVGEVKKVEVSAECKPWKPPIASNDAICNRCGEDGFPCSEYSCNSLGANCKLVGEAPDWKCIDMSPNDVNGPVISAGQTTNENIEITQTENGMRVNRRGEEKCFEDFQDIPVSIRTDEYSYCKVGIETGKKYDEMFSFAEDSNLKKEHNFKINTMDIIEYYNEKGEPIRTEEKKEINLVVKCKDSKNIESRDFIVSVCLIHDDRTAPIISLLSPREILPFGTEKTQVRVLVNENAEVRWSFMDKSFDEMENKMECNIGRSVECFAEIPIKNNEVSIYVRGRDHPEWANTNKAGKRNTNQQSLKITLKVTETQLSIDIVSPKEGEIIYTNLPAVSITVEAHTSGGIPETTLCYLGPGKIDLLPSESLGVFKKIYESFTPGEKVVVIECEDSAGNKASKETRFKIEQDTTVPNVARAYVENEELFIITNSPSVCAYVTENTCQFKVDEKEKLSIRDGLGFLHSTLFDKAKTYYIKCKDSLGNERSAECDIVIKKGDF